MAEVVSIEEARARRTSVAVPQSFAHPVLMWLVDGEGVGHRRVRGQGAACGAEGPLVLAEPGASPCRACYPLRSRQC